MGTFINHLYSFSLYEIYYKCFSYQSKEPKSLVKGTLPQKKKNLKTVHKGHINSLNIGGINKLF